MFGVPENNQLYHLLVWSCFHHFWFSFFMIYFLSSALVVSNSNFTVKQTDLNTLVRTKEDKRKY